VSDAADTETDPPLEPGTLVGEYRVDRIIGTGTFGTVYAGEQPLIGKRVAIKLLRRKLAENPEVLERFVAEARAVNRVRSRHIVDVFSFGSLPGGRHYFVMELLEGTTLGDLLDREHRLGVTRALPILRGIAAALDAAHAAGVVHRDVKPDNVFLVIEDDGSVTPKLLDFGVAKLITDEMGIKTATGVAIGTPRYMSPEQCRGKKVDARADVYSLGALAHEMLTGHPPFTGETPVDLLLKHTCDPPPRMSRVCPDLPPDLDAPVLAMLAKRPADRPDSAGAAIEALAERAGARLSVTTLPLGTIVTGPSTRPDPGGAPASLDPARAATALHDPGGATRVDRPAIAVASPTVVSGSDSPAAAVPTGAPGPAASGSASLSATPVSSAQIPMARGAPRGLVAALVAVLLAAGAFAALRGRTAGPSAPPASAAPPAGGATATTMTESPPAVRVELSTTSAAPAAVGAAPPPASAKSKPRPVGTGRAPAHDIGF
jgi:serine/threonine-protein kinase